MCRFFFFFLNLPAPSMLGSHFEDLFLNLMRSLRYLQNSNQFVFHQNHKQKKRKEKNNYSR